METVDGAGRLFPIHPLPGCFLGRRWPTGLTAGGQIGAKPFLDHGAFFVGNRLVFLGWLIFNERIGLLA